MDGPLTTAESRVLACLIEKSFTTPDLYPLTLNALAAACNQKSNRNPVMELDEAQIVRALDGLRERKLAWSVAAAGSRVPRYRHSAPDVWPLPPAAIAILSELMLRGSQTVAELRVHAGRMTPIADMAEVQAVLDALSARPEGPMVLRLPRQPGQREERYAHLLAGDVAVTAVKPPPEPARAAVIGESQRLAAMEADVAALRQELAELRTQVAEFVQQFR